MDVGTEVWVKNFRFKDPQRDAVWIPTTITAKTAMASGAEFTITMNGKESKFRLKSDTDEADELKPRNVIQMFETEDLNILSHVNEPEILTTLQGRLDSGQLFTYSGKILLMLNPYDIVEASPKNNFFLLRFVEELKSEVVYELRTGGEPSLAMKSSILISGESGSGKTECAKWLMRTLCSSTAKVNAKTGMTTSQYNDWNDKFLLANDLLDAFGNATTVSTANSSRYGKMVEVALTPNGSLASAHFRSFLLEMSRTTSQQPKERNFNIFYQLLASSDEESRLKWDLRSAADYTLLNQGGAKEVLAAFELDRTRHDSFRTNAINLGFLEAELSCLFEVLVVIMSLGQLTFVAGGGSANGCEIAPSNDSDISLPLKQAASLLEVPMVGLGELMTMKSFATPRGEAIRRQLNEQQAATNRDALIKALYKSLFDWFVQRVNTLLVKTDQLPIDTNSIVLVDIFGFDSFEYNSIDQLLINFTNETLQQLFNYHVFKQEIELYRIEGVECDNIVFTDNQATIDLIGNGMFSILDDQCRLPGPSDKRFVAVIYKQYENNPLFKATKNQQLVNKFSVIHFAGEVEYTSEGFIVKNTDNVPSEAGALLATSPHPVVMQMLRQAATNGRRSSLVAPSIASGSSDDPSPVRTPRGGSGSTPSYVAQVKADLAQLISAVKDTKAHYVRCFKPYSSQLRKDWMTIMESTGDRKPPRLCQKLMIDQLVSGGVLEAIKTARTGFHAKQSFHDFYGRYRVLTDEATFAGPIRLDKCMPADEAKALLMALLDSFAEGAHLDANRTNSTTRAKTMRSMSMADLSKLVAGDSHRISKDMFTFGKLFIFIKRRAYELLELYRHVHLRVDVTIIQAAVRSFFKWFKYRLMRTAAPEIQRIIRGFLARREARRRYVVLLTAVTLQRKFRMMKFKRQVISIQNMYRAVRAKTLFHSLQSEHGKLLTLYGPLLIAKDLRAARRLGHVARPADNEADHLSLEERERLYKEKEEALFTAVDQMIEQSKLPEAVIHQASDFPSLLQSLDEKVNTLHNCELKGFVKQILKTFRPANKLLKLKALTDSTPMGRALGPSLWSFVATSLDGQLIPLVLHENHGLFERIKVIINELLEIDQHAETELHGLDDKRVKLRISAAAGDESAKAELESGELKNQMQNVRNVETAVYLIRKYYEAFMDKVIAEYGQYSELRRLSESDGVYLGRLVTRIKALKTGRIRVVHKTAQRQEFLDSAGFVLKLEWKRKIDMQVIDHHEQYRSEHLKESEIRIIEKMNTLEQKRLDFQLENLRVTAVDGIGYQYMPHAPGVTYAVNAMYHLLKGDLSPLFRILKVSGGLKQNGLVVYYLAQTGLTSKSLVDVLYNPVDVEQIEQRSFSAAFVTATVFGLTHIQPNNMFINIEHIKTSAAAYSQQSRFIHFQGFNNDEHMTKMFHHPHDLDTPQRRKLNAAHNLSVLYCLPHMDEAVEPHVLRVFTRPLAGEELVARWLKDLHDQDMRFKRLKAKRFNKADFQRLNIPIKMTAGTAIAALNRLQLFGYVIETSADPKYVTHSNLLDALMPELNAIYMSMRRNSDFATGCEIDGISSYAYIYHHPIEHEKKLNNGTGGVNGEKKLLSFAEILNPNKASMTAEELEYSHNLLASRSSAVRNNMNVTGDNAQQTVASLSLKSGVKRVIGGNAFVSNSPASPAAGTDESRGLQQQRSTRFDIPSSDNKESEEKEEEKDEEEVVPVERTYMCKFQAVTTNAIKMKTVTHRVFMPQGDKDKDATAANGEDEKSAESTGSSDPIASDEKTAEDLSYEYHGDQPPAVQTAEDRADSFTTSELSDEQRIGDSNPEPAPVIEAEVGDEGMMRMEDILQGGAENADIDPIMKLDTKDDSNAKAEGGEIDDDILRSYPAAESEARADSKDQIMLAQDDEDYEDQRDEAEAAGVEGEVQHGNSRTGFEAPSKEFQAIKGKLKEHKQRIEKDRLVLELTRRNYELTGHGHDRTVAEESFNFLRQYDWRTMALNANTQAIRERAMEVCTIMGQCLSFIPSLWFNHPTEWQLHAFFKPWLECYSDKHLLEAPIVLQACEVIIYCENLSALNAVRKWPLLIRLYKRIHLDLKFAVASGKPSPNQALQQQYDIYAYNPIWEEHDEDDWGDVDDEGLKQNLFLRRHLLRVVFACANLMSQDDVVKLEKDVTVCKDVIHHLTFYSKDKEIDTATLRSFSTLVVEYPGLAEIGTYMAQRGLYAHDKAIIHRLISHPLAERFQDFAIAILRSHPEVLMLVDKDKNYAVCDAIRRIEENKPFKFRLLCEFVNFAAEPAQRHYQSQALVSSGVSLTNAKGILSSYRGEEELIVLATHYDIPTTVMEFKQKKYDNEKRDSIYGEKLLMRLLIDEINATEQSVKDKAFYVYTLLSKAIKERIFARFIFGEVGEQMMWKSFDFGSRSDEQKEQYNLSPETLSASRIMQDMRTSWAPGTFRATAIKSNDTLGSHLANTSVSSASTNKKKGNSSKKSAFSLFSGRSRDGNHSPTNGSSRQSSFNYDSGGVSRQHSNALAISLSVDSADDVGLSRHNSGARGLHGLLSKQNSGSSSLNISPRSGNSRQNSGASALSSRPGGAGNLSRQGSAAGSLSPMSRQNSGAYVPMGRMNSLRTDALYTLTEEDEPDNLRGIDTGAAMKVRTHNAKRDIE